jgi:hypothetical protein
LFRLDLASASEREIQACVMARALAVVGDHLYFIGCAVGQRDVPLYQMNLTTGDQKILGTLERGLNIFMGLAVSPDEKTILFG